MLKQKQRATYGHHGRSIGSSRDDRKKRKKDVKETFMAHEAEAARRKRTKAAETKDPKLKQLAKHFREETEGARKRKAPSKRPRRHEHPGEKPKTRAPLPKDYQIATASGVGLDEWAGKGDTYRYKAPAVPEAPETPAEKRAREERYAYKGAGATTEQLAKHAEKVELHRHEEMKVAAEQKAFEEVGERKLNPLRETVVEDLPVPPTPTPKETSLRPGHKAQIAAIMRKRELQSDVAARPPVAAAPAPKQPVVQTQPPRDLTKLGQRDTVAEKQAQFEAKGRQQYKEAQQKAAFARQKAKFEHEQQQKFVGDHAEKQMFQYMVGRHKGLREVQPIVMKDPTSKTYEQQRIKAVQAEQHAMAEEERHYAKKQEVQQHRAKLREMEKALQEKEQATEAFAQQGQRQVLKETQEAFGAQQEIRRHKPDSGIPQESHLYGLQDQIKRQRNKKVVDSIQATGGPRDVLQVIPDTKLSYAAKAAQKGLATFRKQPEFITKAHFQTEKRPRPNPESDLPEASRLRLEGPAQGAMVEHTAVGTKHGLETGGQGKKRRRAGGEEQIPLPQEKMAQLAELKKMKRSRTRAQGTAGMKAQMLARAPDVSKGAEMTEGQRIIQSVTSLIHEQQAKPAPSVLDVQSTNPARTETSVVEPDRNTQDPAIASAAPAGTGQEPQLSSAVQNVSATDTDLAQLDAQLSGGGGGGLAEMGAQAGAGGGAPAANDAYHYPRPPAQSIYGPPGGIEALEEKHAEVSKPSPDVAQQAAGITQSEELERLRNLPTGGKSSDELAAEAVLTARAERHVHELRKTPVTRRTPTQVEQIKETTRLLEKEGFEEQLWRQQAAKPVAVRAHDPRTKSDEKQQEEEQKRKQNLPSLLRKQLIKTKHSAFYKPKRRTADDDPTRTDRPTRNPLVAETRTKAPDRPPSPTKAPDRPPSRKMGDYGTTRNPATFTGAAVPLTGTRRGTGTQVDPTNSDSYTRRRTTTGTDTDPAGAKRKTGGAPPKKKTDLPESFARLGLDPRTGTDPATNRPVSRRMGDYGTTKNPGNIKGRDPVDVRDRPRAPSAPPAQPRRELADPRQPYTNNPTNNPVTTTTTSTNPQIQTNPQINPEFSPQIDPHIDPQITHNPTFNPNIGTGPVGGGEGGSVGPVDASGRGGTTGPVSMGGHGGMHLNMSGGGWGGGGGGAVAAASSSGAGSGGGGQGGAQQAAGTILAALKKKKKKQSGITAAKKRYTDKRKVKFAELRALKAKRLREHAAKTKKLPKKERDKQRREFKAKVNAQYKEVTKRFPPARGLKDLQTVKSLIEKLDRVRLPS